MNYTWVTLADSEDYLKNVYSLAFSLKKSNTLYPLQVMIPEGQIDQCIIDLFISKCKYLDYPVRIIFIPNLMFNVFTPFTNVFNSTLNKFFIFNLEEYDKIIFLDSDIFMLTNCDYMFNFTFPIIDQRNNEISSNIFGIHPDKNIWYFILNICFTHPFQNDEEVIGFLYNSNFFPLNTFISNNKNYFHDGGHPKYWSIFSWNELNNYLQNNYNNIYSILSKKNSKNIKIKYSNQKEQLYLNNIKAKIKNQYN